MKASLKRASESATADAKPGDLPLSRLKGGCVEKLSDEARVGVKGQSNPEIARTPRNVFRCSLEWDGLRR